MKKNYLSPELVVINIKNENHLMAASPAGGDNPILDPNNAIDEEDV